MYQIKSNQIKLANQMIQINVRLNLFLDDWNELETGRAIPGHYANPSRRRGRRACVLRARVRTARVRRVRTRDRQRMNYAYNRDKT